MTQVSLRPHTGRTGSGREIDLGQDRIFVDGQAVGFVLRKPGSPINLIYRDLPVATVEAIEAAVLSKHGQAASKVSVPPEMPEESDETVDDENSDE